MMVMDSGGGGCANQKVEFTFWTKKYPPPLARRTEALNLMDTTPAVAQARALFSQLRGFGWGARAASFCSS